jgi:hypothetical protein
MVNKNPKMAETQIEEPHEEVLKEIKNERQLFFSYDNLPKQAKPYSVSKEKFEALQKVFSDEYAEEEA